MFHNHIFNLHDQSLLLVIFQCMLLAILLPFSKPEVRRSNLLLSLFLLAIGVTAADALFYWNVVLKSTFAEQGIEFFMFFKFSVYATGPLLYFYTKSKLYSDFEFTRRDFLHLLPLSVFPFLMFLTLQSLSQAQVHMAVFDYQVLFNVMSFKVHLTATFILHILYASCSLHLIYQYQEKLEENYSTLVDIDYSWLKMIIIGFIGISFWKVLAHVTNWLSDWFNWGSDAASAMGLVSNVFMFIFINTVVVYSLVHSNVLKGINSKPDNKEPQENPEPEEVSAGHIARVNRLITEDKVYLYPSITLEQIAEKAQLTTRQLSSVINRHFEKNFFDFINYYRVEHAKSLLCDPNYLGSMLDIMADSGFNSKSAFNRFFKKYTNNTPSEYRRSKKSLAV